MPYKYKCLIKKVDLIKLKAIYNYLNSVNNVYIIKIY
jgi:hypothetical protein